MVGRYQPDLTPPSGQGSSGDRISDRLRSRMTPAAQGAAAGEAFRVFEQRSIVSAIRKRGWRQRIALSKIRHALQVVRYVIHTITFFAVFGSEKVYFPFEHCVFSKISDVFKNFQKILERFRNEILKN